MFLFRMAFGLVRVAFKLTLVLAFAGAITLVVYTFFWLPDVTSLAGQNPETTAFIERTRSRIRREGLPLKVVQTWVPLASISKELVEAVLIAEDDRFYQHKGFDLTEIRNSLLENIREGRWARGGSTLSQQLAKNLYLSPDKTLRRKFDEMILTWKLESRLSKERILEIYLNVVDWGEGRFGAEAAAQFYFSKPASRLTGAEAASLAARLPNPDYLSSNSGTDRRRHREDMILERMLKQKPHEVTKEPVLSVARKPQPSPPSPQGPLLPQATTLFPGMTGQAAQMVGSLFKDKVTQALAHLENVGPKKAFEDSPEEPPRAILESPASPDRVALASPSSPDSTAGRKASMANPTGVAPSGGPPPPVASQTSGDGVAKPATPRPLPVRVSSPTLKEKPAPSSSSPRRSKRLKESLARLESVLGK